jgi:hypothetical protein
VSGSDISVQPFGSPTATMLDVHQLIQEAVIYNLKDTISEYFTAIVFVLFNTFKRLNVDNLPEKDEWRAYSLLLPHVFSMVRCYKAFKVSLATSTPPNFYRAAVESYCVRLYLNYLAQS